MMIAKILYSNVFIPKMWQFHVPIAMQRGSSIVWDLTERGKMTRDNDGYEYMKLRNRKKVIPIPIYSKVNITNTGKNVYHMYNPTTDEYTPMEVWKDKGFVVRNNTATKNWMVMELQRTDELYPRNENKWLKWMPYIMTGGLAAIMVFFVIYYGGKVEIIGNSIAGATVQLAEAVSKFGTQTPPAP